MGERERLQMMVELKRRRAAQQKESPAIESIEVPEASLGETATRALASGTSLGFSDELSGVAPFIHALTTGKRLTDEDKGRFMNAVNAYRMTRRDEEAQNARAFEANPKTAMALKLAGGIIPAVATGGSSLLAESPVLAATAFGATQGLGDSNADLTKGQFGEALLDTGKGAAVSAALGGVLKGIPILGKKLGAGAEKMAENATGATGRFAEKEFQSGLGRKLLDEGYIKPFSNTEGLATRLQKGLDTAKKNIDESVLAMDKAGAKVDPQTILSKLDETISGLKTDPSQAQTVKQLEGFKDDILNSWVENKGAPSLPSEAENIKRGFYGRISNFTDPEKQKALKEAARAYKTSVEDVAESVSPEVSAMFSKGKKDWGMLAPAEQAASGRTATLNQSPVGGLLDTAAFGAGEIAKGGAGLPAMVARKLLMPRVTQTLAYGVDKASKAIGAVPTIPAQAQTFLSRIPGIISDSNNKYSQLLKDAESRGERAVAVTNYTLLQKDPEYKKQVEAAQGGE